MVIGRLCGARGPGEIPDELAELERERNPLGGAPVGGVGAVHGLVEGVALAQARSVEGQDHGQTVAQEKARSTRLPLCSSVSAPGCRAHR